MRARRPRLSRVFPFPIFPFWLGLRLAEMQQNQAFCAFGVAPPDVSGSLAGVQNGARQ